MAQQKHLPQKQEQALPTLPERLAISDKDIYTAMQEIQGYLDITANDFKELYQLSYHHAIARLTSSVRAGDIMTREVVTVTTATPLQEVASRMANASISGVPVVETDGSLAGIVSERDFLNHMGAQNGSFMAVVAACLQGQGCAAIDIRQGVAADIMSRPAITLSKDAPLAEIAAVMAQNDINRLPITSADNGKIVGILTRHDLLATHIV